MPGGSRIGNANYMSSVKAKPLQQDPKHPVLIEPYDVLGPNPGEIPQRPMSNHVAALLPPQSIIEDDAAGEDIELVIEESEQVLELAKIPGDADEPRLLDEGAGSMAQADRKLGPYQTQDYHEFRARHYESARGVVEALRTKPGVELTDKQRLDLEALEGELKVLAVNATSASQVGSLEEWQSKEPDNLDALRAKLVGGTKGPDYGWFRCIFSTNARRARSIQRLAEDGKPFSRIYTKKKLKHIHPKAALALYIRGRLKGAGLGKLPGTSTAEISKQLSAGYIKLTEKSQAWSQYSRVHNFAGKGASGGKALAMKSTLTPACELPALQASFPPNDVRGVSSMNSKNETHAVNLWKTEFSPAAPSEGVSFKGFRHGVLDAYGIKGNEPKREAANLAKARELVRAAASEMPHTIKKSAQGEWTIPMVSVSLQTGGLRGDSSMINAQEAALRSLEGRGVEMPGPDPDGNNSPWVVKPDCLQFFIGVNEGALGGVKFINRPWSTRRDRNNEAIDKLLKRASDQEVNLKAQAALPSPESGMTKTALEHRIAVIGELRTQIEGLRRDRTYENLDADPYKLPPRILLLAHLLDNVACFNCKSGKDRTGMVDIETKALVQSINRNIASREPGSREPLVPAYGVARDDQAKAEFAELHRWGGGQHVSRANTGLMGNKSDIGNYLRDNLDDHTVMLVSGFARHADGNK
jgi:hypothetical protein